MKTLTLDYSKWRAGGTSVFSSKENEIGQGDTRLLNESGFMCCLGQFALQCDFSVEEIIRKNGPCDLRKEMPLFNQSGEYGFVNTSLACKCIGINDDRTTTYKQKIFSLHRLLKEHGIELIVINTPEPINLQ